MTTIKSFIVRENLIAITVAIALAFMAGLLLIISVWAAVFLASVPVLLVAFRLLDCWRVLLILVVGSQVAAASGAAEHLGLFYGRYLLLACLALLSFTRYGAGYWTGKLRLFAWQLSAATVYFFATAVWSRDPTRSLQHALAFAFIVIIVVCSLKRWQDEDVAVRDLLWIFVSLGLVGLVSILMHMFGLDFGRSTSRLSGVYRSPNTFAMMAALMIPLAAILGRSFWQRAIVWILWVVQVAGLLMTESRTSAAAAIIGIALAFTIIKRRSNTGTAPRVLLLAVGAVLVLYLVQYGNVLDGSRLANTDQVVDNLSGRDVLWQAAISDWATNPVLGIGFRATEIAIEEGVQGGRRSTHNGFLQLGAETGALGLIATASFVVTGMMAMVRSQQKSLVSGLLGAVCSGLVVQLGESSLFGTGAPFAFVFFLILGMGVSLSKEQPAHPSTQVYERRSKGFSRSRSNPHRLASAHDDW